MPALRLQDFMVVAWSDAISIWCLDIFAPVFVRSQHRDNQSACAYHTALNVTKHQNKHR